MPLGKFYLLRSIIAENRIWAPHVGVNYAAQFLKVANVLIVTIAALLLAVGPVMIATTEAAVARILPLNARLLSSSGSVVSDGTYQFTFAIYASDSGGSALWSETQNIQVTGGLVAVNLGSSTALPSSLDFNSEPYYLGIKVGSDPEASPRKRIGSVPSAINADMVDGAHAGTGANNVLQLNSSGNLNIAGTLQGGGLTVSNFLVNSSGNITKINNVTYSFPSSQGASSTVLTNDGSGNLTWAAAGGGSVTLQDAYGNGNSITTTSARDIDFILANTATDSNLDIQIATDSTSTVSISRSAGTGTANPSQLLVVEDLDADLTIADGLTVRTAGVLTDAIDVSDAEITNAINVGANILLGTTGNIDYTNFDVTGSSGNVVAAGSITVSETGGYLFNGRTTIIDSPAANRVRIASGTSQQELNVYSSGTSVGEISSGSPLATQLLHATNATGTNIAGSALVVTGGDSTGNAAGGYISFETTPAGASGSSANAGVERLRIDSLGQLIANTSPQASATASLLQLGPAIAGGSASGTFIGSNPAAFSGNFLDFQVAGASVAKITSAGALTVASCTGCGGGAALDTLTAATTDDAALLSGDNTIEWNWALTSATSKGFTIGESAASTGGAGDQHILRLDTASGSTAGPLEVVSNSADGGDIEINLNSAGDFEIQDAGTAFVTFSDAGLTTFVNDVDITLGAGENLAVSASAAPTVDILTVSNSGQGVTATSGVDALAITYVQSANATAVTGSGVDISLTPSADATDVIRGITLNNVTAGGSTETGLYIGTGYDRDIELADTSPTLVLANTATLSVTDATNTLFAFVDSGTFGTLQGGSNVNLAITGAGTGDVLLNTDADTDLFIGDGGVTNYARFDATGTLTFSGSGRPFSEIFLLPNDVVLPDSPVSGTDCVLTKNLTNNRYQSVDCGDGAVATDEAAFWQFKMSQNYVNAANVQVDIYWISDVATGKVDWEPGYIATSPDTTENYDTGARTDITGQTGSTVSGTINAIKTSTYTFTSPSINADDSIILRLNRDLTDTTEDTATGMAKIIKIRIRFLVSS